MMPSFALACSGNGSHGSQNDDFLNFAHFPITNSSIGGNYRGASGTKDSKSTETNYAPLKLKIFAISRSLYVRAASTPLHLSACAWLVQLTHTLG